MFSALKRLFYYLHKFLENKDCRLKFCFKISYNRKNNHVICIKELYCCFVGVASYKSGNMLIGIHGNLVVVEVMQNFSRVA
jgi:hypothetical protein